ncbi:unnamed protein product [Boreogadus saida]
MPTRPGPPVTEDYSEDLSEDRISPAAGIRPRLTGGRHNTRVDALERNATRDKVHPEELQLAEGERTTWVRVPRRLPRGQSKLPSHITVAPPSFSAPLLGSLSPAAPPVKAQPLGSLL